MTERDLLVTSGDQLIFNHIRTDTILILRQQLNLQEQHLQRLSEKDHIKQMHLLVELMRTGKLKCTGSTILVQLNELPKEDMVMLGISFHLFLIMLIKLTSQKKKD